MTGEGKRIEKVTTVNFNKLSRLESFFLDALDEIEEMKNRGTSNLVIKAGLEYFWQEFNKNRGLILDAKSCSYICGQFQTKKCCPNDIKFHRIKNQLMHLVREVGLDLLPQIWEDNPSIHTLYIDGKEFSRPKELIIDKKAS